MSDPAAGATAGEVRCPKCRRPTTAMVSFAEQVTVVEGPGGAISTRSRQVLERRCGWCGALLARARPVEVRDLPSL